MDLRERIECLYGTGLDRPVEVLAVGAHPDDVELAAGGTLALLARQGIPVGIVDLTNGEPTPHGSPETRREESQEAARILGVTTRITLTLPNRMLFDTVEGRRLVAAVVRLLRPRLLLAHFWEDAHPDHWAACALADAGRFYGKLTRTDLPGDPHWVPRAFYFFATHLRLHRPVSFVVDVSSVWERKMAAVRVYRSQFGLSETGRRVPDRVEARDRYFGQLVGREFGEPFASREPIGVDDLRGLVW